MIKKRTINLTPEENATILRQLLNGHGVARLRFMTQTDHLTGMPNYVNIDDLIDFLTDLAEQSLEDNKQEAYKGLRTVFRALKRCT